MLNFCRKHPLASVLLAALTVRLLAVIWSQGFIHSDDHFDTVAVAWEWLHGGLWGDNGYLRWGHKLSPSIGRFPLYTLALCGEMKLCQMLGIDALGSMMYLVRFTHALISMLPVWAIYTIVRRVTGSVRWAAAGGLMAGLHFAFPFLGVRNLIEMVGGSFWIVAICCLYRYRYEPRTKWLYLAGLATGLAWMIRFQIAFAVLPLPLVLWWETRQWRAAVHYSAAVAAMLILSGFVDLWLLGRFASSSLAYLGMNAGYGSLYSTIPFMYPILFLLLMVPPFSLLAAYAALRKSFIRQHLLLLISTGSFLAVHWLHPHQQERFIFPMLPVFLLIAVLALWQYTRDRGPMILAEGWRRKVIVGSIAINLLLLATATFAYGHKGMIEPLVWFEMHAPRARVLFVQPGIKRWVPVQYGGEGLSPTFIRKSSDFELLPLDSAARSGFDYVVVYPRQAEDLTGLMDSLQSRVGRLEPVFEVAPSNYDQLLHILNRRHNDNYAAFIYRPQ